MLFFSHKGAKMGFFELSAGNYATNSAYLKEYALYLAGDNKCFFSKKLVKKP
jgi:hypothetical protein